MIRVTPPALSTVAATSLKQLQSRINGLSSYPERVAEARLAFKGANRPANPTFDAVKKALAEACAGARRCMYCEDSAADEIEHFRPLSFYPDLVFVWENYLYACGPCNNAKLNRFRVVSSQTGEVVDLTRRRGDPVIPPEDGSAVLLDPRSDDPLEYMRLDLLNTFRFLPRHPIGTPQHMRAHYTIELLRLNERDILPEARREAYGHYRARLREYVQMRGTSPAASLASAIVRCCHPVVWAEMKAQAHLVDDLGPLFEAAPEARTW